jgi:Zn-dependent membrane protease YugP
MLWFDPMWMLFMLPGMLLAGWAQYRVTSTFGKYRQVATSRGMSGADIARAILQVNDIRGVRVEPVQGFLSDHYDPRSRTLRLSPDVFAGRTVAAAGVAAHEVGHAIQHAQGYAPMQLRAALVPALSITSRLSMPAILIGFVLMSMGSVGLGQTVLLFGAALFAVMVLFQIVTLPVELDASRRALVAIERGHLVTGTELAGARKVLSAAALTYVAAAVSSVLQLLYFLWRAGLLGGSRDD